MSDIMVPIPFRKLLSWTLEEYQSEGTIFGIPEENFYYLKDDAAMRVFGERCETPLGPAAGPHTQVAQNIAAAYLTGGRFFELKTVQIMDELEIDKPCIDAERETYNTEWSTELTVPQAYGEYVKAWFLLHLLNEIFGFSRTRERGFVFNMSVGYDLEGIQSPKIDSFIEGLKDAADAPIFHECRRELIRAVENDEIPGVTSADFVGEISPSISHSVTLSTMHGTPPEDQEAICKYLMAEKGLHTYVKLNPTLHGYEYVRDAFQELGYDHIQLKEKSFTSDMQYPAAVEMIRSLLDHAEKTGVEFGVKLSNTLAVVNDKGTLPTDEMYMSGRALYPLTVNLAHKLSREFDGRLTISYSGGADYFNAADLLLSGLKPITMATYFLKPGGYSRMTQLAELLETEVEALERNTVDLEVLERVAADALTDPRYAFEGKSPAPMKTGEHLPLLDCFLAPCTIGCPIHQDVPEYIRLIHKERYAEAYRLIIAKNPLPFITGYICDHQCQLKCVRNDYEDAVQIRDLKHIAAEKGFAEVIGTISPPEERRDTRAAVIGAGPAGLSAGYFLAQEGFQVTVFDKLDLPGGMVAHGIPDFRYPEGTVEKDVELIKRAGVEFELNCDPDLNIQQMREAGFDYVVLAIGAWKSRELQVEGEQERVRGAINFLQDFKDHPQKIKLGERVAVIGGGNSAMDSARAALRVPGVEQVSILYRRTIKQMPADREELENALKDGVIFEELVSPLSLEGVTLTCQMMELGEKDASGRRRPVPVEGKTVSFPVDTVLTAIGELVDYELLEENGIAVGEGGEILVDEFNETSVDGVFIVGDAYRGPATVVEGIADARRAADGILRRERSAERLLTLPVVDFDEEMRLVEAREKKAVLSPRVSPENFEQDYRAESGRCLECSILCNKCVSVCPNRANVAVEVESGGLEKVNQILHLDALCNECGNCETFCPYQGAPYLEKFTLFWDEQAFQESENEGYLPLAESGLRMRYQGEIHDLSWGSGEVIPRDEELIVDGELQGLFDLMLTVRDRYPYLLPA
ncbi:MAG: putative selenate reductase subunit YgfK [Anaerolineales bacterium]|nr:putative selenate reductase subunit YgfK [Anaerolineales bacterium]